MVTEEIKLESNKLSVLLYEAADRFTAEHLSHPSDLDTLFVRAAFASGAALALTELRALEARDDRRR